MTIHLRKGEELVRQLHFHWADDWRSWLWAFLCLIAGIVNALDRDFLWMAVFLIASPLPLISRLYTQAFQACLITNKRIYLERGVFSKAKW
ncbi:MAG: hypothetical protein KDK78_12060, partial [Chlamydiia bacterium]|nr:hypothetical protein [Chlamydiia bacterium]